MEARRKSRKKSLLKERLAHVGRNLSRLRELSLQTCNKLSLVLDTVGGTPVGDLAKALKAGGSVVVYALQSGTFPVLSPIDLIYRGLSLHGFWVSNWIRNAPHAEIQKTYQKLGALAGDGSLFAAVDNLVDGFLLRQTVLPTNDLGQWLDVAASKSNRVYRVRSSF